eukprot:4739279-Amphidinium_carterae.1
MPIPGTLVEKLSKCAPLRGCTPQTRARQQPRQPGETTTERVQAGLRRERHPPPSALIASALVV